jgi:hypothetical protein
VQRPSLFLEPLTSQSRRLAERCELQHIFCLGGGTATVRIYQTMSKQSGCFRGKVEVGLHASSSDGGSCWVPEQDYREVRS